MYFSLAICNWLSHLNNAKGDRCVTEDLMNELDEPEYAMGILFLIIKLKCLAGARNRLQIIYYIMFIHLCLPYAQQKY